MKTGKTQMIHTENVTKSFAGKQVLNGVGITINSGEIFGLLGPSGAGKTTFIKILTGQLPPDSGTAEILGTDSGKLDGKTYEKIGMVLDDSGLYERLSCYDNLVLFADIYGINRREIDRVLEKTGLLPAKKLAASKLSKGMRQRLVFARALLHKPEILFLDEPTSGLDPVTLHDIHRIILEEKERGVAVFLTTHNMEEAAKLCGNIGLLFQGTLVEYGEPEALCIKYDHQKKIQMLLKNGKYAVVENGAGAAEIVARCLLEDQVVSIHSTEPTLENVFMELTGRSLNENEENICNPA